MDLRSRKPFRRKKTLEIVLHDIPEDPKAGFGGTKIPETVLYGTPVPRKAPPEGQKYSKLFCMTHLCPERRLRRDKTRDNAGRVLCGNFGSFSGGNKKIQTGVCIFNGDQEPDPFSVTCFHWYAVITLKDRKYLFLWLYSLSRALSLLRNP